MGQDPTTQELILIFAAQTPDPLFTDPKVSISFGGFPMIYLEFPD